MAQVSHKVSLCAKSNQFMQLILKHHPLTEASTERDKPYLHFHDYRKERDIYERPTSEKLANMELFKSEGNNHYRNGRLYEAASFYHKVIVYGDYTFPDLQEDKQSLLILLQQSHCNRALCLIKLQKWEDVRQHLNEAIKGPQLDLKKKGLYWLIKDHLRNAERQRAIETLQMLISLGGEEAIVNELRTAMNRR